MGEEQITEDGERVDYHTVEITISRIRKKLEAYSGRTDFIITIRGRGYKFRKWGNDSWNIVRLWSWIKAAGIFRLLFC